MGAHLMAATDTARDWASSTRPPPAFMQRRKITSAQADEIRERYADGDGETIGELALAYGVSTRTIRHYIS